MIFHNIKVIKNESGYLLIEAIVASGLLIVGLISIAGLMSRALSLNRVVSDQFIANYLAVEGIEIVKNLIEADILDGGAWNDSINSNGCYEVDYESTNFWTTCSSSESQTPLSFDNLTGLYSYDSGGSQTPTPFRRSILIDIDNSGERIRVNSVVKWISRGNVEFSVDLEDYFFNYR